MLAGGFQPSGIGLYRRSSTRPRAAVLSSRGRFLNISGTYLQELYGVDPVPDIDQDTVTLDTVPIADAQSRTLSTHAGERWYSRPSSVSSE